MLPYPAATTREQKLAYAHRVKDRLLAEHPGRILAIGLYGSVARGTDQPCSDLELHVVAPDGAEPLPGDEFVELPFKLELSCRTRAGYLARAARVDDGWPIWAGSFTHVMPLHDPKGLFALGAQAALDGSEEAFRGVMREFMVWEPYETMGKIRNLRASGENGHLPRAAMDLTWQAAKLIGLANRRPFTTRVRTLREAAALPSQPDGFAELAALSESGRLQHADELHAACERLWSGLNRWFEELGLEYRRDAAAEMDGSDDEQAGGCGGEQADESDGERADESGGDKRESSAGEFAGPIDEMDGAGWSWTPVGTSAEEREALAALLTGEPWPYHGIVRPEAETIRKAFDDGAYHGDETRTFWIEDAAGAKAGLLKIMDTQDPTLLFDLRIRQAYRRQGAARSTLRWMADYVFREFPSAIRIEGHTRTDNAGMQAAFRGTLFVLESCHRQSWPQEGRLYDSFGYGLLRGDWERGAATPVPAMPR
ncbi:kanamycin nucleotidyltransferase C-terminal domain-containing protein [Paenibacillus pasadenensis]|uniref:Acetyltransferase, GNAT family n=1 Tax=Paenibacillus pasadenensis TaxID=217090 RepID=A0A2N5N0N2_9BACL|nr:kanamycin nucleotidyltransferase C-terminal domain-containing protein [Paenibacillus pasadenensis]PLT43893.1 acetyltransferase, GNAT family [Paenibacillus pasadenensis]